MPLQFMHRLHIPDSYPLEASERAPHVLEAWLRYAPDAQPEARDWEDWAENAYILYAMDKLAPNNVRILDTIRLGGKMSGDNTTLIPSRPGATPTFMFGMFKPMDSVDFPEDADLVCNHSGSVRRAQAYSSSATFLKAAGRDFYVVDAEETQIEAALLKMHAAGHREVFIKTRFKESAGLYKLPEEPINLWRSIQFSNEEFEWFLVTYEGSKKCLFIQEPFKPTKEYRMVVVGDRPVTGAGCVEAYTPLDNRGDDFDDRVEEIRNRSHVTSDPETVSRYLEFATQFAKDWAAEQGADMAYSLDLAVDANTGDIKAIEINPLLNLGLYANRPERLIEAVCALHP